MEKIYLDYNATTPLDPRVLDEMIPYLKNNYGNPSSIHSYGNKAKAALDESRERVSDFLRAKPGEIVFTGGGSESNNFAIKGAAFSLKEKGNHLITVNTEHASCLEVFRFLEKQGFEVTYLSVDKFGLIDLDLLKSVIKDNTILISCMFVNNETGVINPIEKIGNIARENNILFHSDMVQAAGKIKIDISAFPLDLASFSSHKIYGPKGVGALYIRKGTNINPLIHGGGQERGKRSGTENVAGIFGFGKACEFIKDEINNQQKILLNLREYLYEKLSKINGVYLNGHPDNRVSNTLNMGFEDIEGESLVMNLDLEGIAVSTGSACSEGNVDPSHVLLAMGLGKKEAISSLRISFGKFTKKDDIEKIIEVLPKIVERIRGFK